MCRNSAQLAVTETASDDLALVHASKNGDVAAFEELYSAAELREILRKTLQELGPGLRMVFVLRDIEGLSLEQTAEALGLSLSAVKARSWRARLQLRERLSKYFNTPEKFAGVEPRASHPELADLERCQTVRGTLAA